MTESVTTPVDSRMSLDEATNRSTPKTVAEMVAQREILAEELRLAKLTIAENGLRQHRLTVALTDHALGIGSATKVKAAKEAIEEVADALSKRSHIDQALTDLDRSIGYAKSRRRRSSSAAIFAPTTSPRMSSTWSSARRFCSSSSCCAH